MTAAGFGIIVFSRMSSSRLPGKAMLPFEDRPLVQHIWLRARCTGYPVFLATSDRPDDDVLARLAESDEIPVYRGSLDDVLGRAAGAAEYWQLDGFARLCGDRPFFCIEGMTRALDTLSEKMELGPSSVSLVSNAVGVAPSPGLATEAICAPALKQVARECHDPYKREHVTPALYEGFRSFRPIKLEDPREYYTSPSMAVDTMQDYRRLSKAYSLDPRIDLTTPEAIASLRRVAAAR